MMREFEKRIIAGFLSVVMCAVLMWTPSLEVHAEETQNVEETMKTMENAVGKARKTGIIQIELNTTYTTDPENPMEYQFTPKETGIYRFKGEDVWFSVYNGKTEMFSDLDVADGKLEKGKTYSIIVDAFDIVTWSVGKLETVNIQSGVANVTVQNDALNYQFIPTETGIYQFTADNYFYFLIYDSNGEYVEEISGNVYELEKGRIYNISNFYFEEEKIIWKVEKAKINNLQLDTEYTASGNQGDIVYQYVPGESGIYEFSYDADYLMCDVLYKDYEYDYAEEVLEAYKLEKGKTYYIVINAADSDENIVTWSLKKLKTIDIELGKEYTTTQAEGTLYKFDALETGTYFITLSDSECEVDTTAIQCEYANKVKLELTEVTAYYLTVKPETEVRWKLEKAKVSGDYAYSVNADNTAEILTYLGKAADISIPGTIDGKPVAAIGGEAFADASMRKVTIPASVKTINSGAFSWCYELYDITLPNSVKSMGQYAMYETAWYNNQADGVTYLNHCLYDYKGDMPAKAEIKVKNGTSVIADGAFEGQTNLVDVMLPNSVETIGTMAFYDCMSMSSVFIPESVAKIGPYAFGYKDGKRDKNFVIYGKAGTEAEKYANENGFKFVSEQNINAAIISVSSQTYTGKALTPSVTVNLDGVTLKNGLDYKVTYTNNINVGTAAATITGIRKYAGTIKKSFKINPRNISSSASVTLSATHHTYTGNVKTPTVTVKYGSTVLKKDRDYTVSYSSGRKYIGRYAVKVTFRGNYSGSKTMYFTIGPKNPTSVTTSLYGYDDVQLKWSKVSGASGYVIYYKKSTSSSYVKLGVVSAAATSYKKANLADGAQYTFKVVAYKKVGNYNCYNAGKTSSIYTLRKPYTPVVSGYGSKVKVKWSNIAGESGYQISRSTSKTGTYIAATYKTTTGTTGYVSATKGKYYYYKVRAYRQVGSAKVYGPWSNVVRYRR